MRVRIRGVIYETVQGEEPMKIIVLAYLLITWVDGSQSGFKLPAGYPCGDAMDDAIAQARDMGFKYEMMQCIYTDQIIVSPRPMPRPKDLK